MDRTPRQLLPERQPFRSAGRSSMGLRLRRRHAGAIAAAGVVVVLAACGSGSSSSTRATVDALAKVDYPGRLLLSVPRSTGVGSPDLDHLSQLTSRSPDPTDLDGPSPDGYVAAVSADGSRIAFKAGRSDAGPLTVFGPAGTQEAYQVGSGVGPMVFSPDGTRLAYNTGNSVQVSDPVTHQLVQLLPPTECKSYSRGPADSSRVNVCGGVGGPVWLDPTTLYLTHFVGEMPSSVSCPDSGSCSVTPDTASIVSLDGTSTNTDTSPGYAPVAAHGSTIVLDGSPGQGSFCSWIDVDQLRAGTASVTPLPAGALMHSLSPDGTRIVVAGSPGKPWELLDLRSGAVQELGTRTTAAYWPVSDVPVFWSPDGKFFAVQVGGVLVPHSKQYGSFRAPPGANHFGVAIWVVPASSEKGGVVATLPPTDATPAPSASEATVLIGWAS